MLFCEHSLQHCKVPSPSVLLKKCRELRAAFAVYRQKSSIAQPTCMGEKKNHQTVLQRFPLKTDPMQTENNQSKFRNKAVRRYWTN